MEENQNRCSRSRGGRIWVFALGTVTLITGSLYSGRLFGRGGGLERYRFFLSLDETPNQAGVNQSKPDSVDSYGLPSLSTLAGSDLPRSRNPCPKELELEEWNGRIGNHYFQISQVIVFALLCGVSSVTFPDPILNPKGYQSQVGMLLMPKRLFLEGVGVPGTLSPGTPLYIPASCPPIIKDANWYHQHCTGVPAFRHRQVMQHFLRPNLGQSLLELEKQLSAPSDSNSASDQMLTVHLRGDDVGRVPHYEMSQPPCSLYRRIIFEHHYKSVTLVHSGFGRKPACADLFKKDLNDFVRLHIPSEGSIVHHFATLMSAKYLFLSFSSFAVSAALLSKEVKVLYRRIGVEWESVLHSNLNCNIWPGTVMYEYKAYNVPMKSLKEGGPLRWLQEFPWWNFTGPYVCEYGRQEGKFVEAADPFATTTTTTTTSGATTTTTTTTVESFEVNVQDPDDESSRAASTASDMNVTLPSVYSMSCDPEVKRFNKRCPETVTIKEWNGRIGNHYFQISQAIVFAVMCSTPIVQFPKLIYAPKKYQNQIGMLAIPRQVLLRGSRSHGQCMVPKACPVNFERINWYHGHCLKIPVWRHRQVMQKFLRPNLGQDLLRTEARAREAWEDEAMLTIHLRGEDVREKPLYQQNQPPCRMYDRILSDHSYKSVSVVKVGWTACDGFIRGLGKRMNVRVHASSIVEDFAMLMRARNLAVSFSSFAMSAAILSKEIQVMYRRRDAEWDSVMHSILNCALWPGVVMYEYNTTFVSYRHLPKPFKYVDEWLNAVPDENITGPFKCEYGSEIQPDI